MLKTYLLELPRNTKRLIMVFTDIITLIAIAWISLVIRKDGFVNIYEEYEITGASSKDIIHFLIIAPIITVAFLIGMRLYRSVVRYINVKTYASIAQACLLSTLVIFSYTSYMNILIPKLIYPLYFILSTAMVFYTRYTASSYLAFKQRNKRKRVLIYDYDEQSIKLSELLKNNNEYEIIGFVIDSDKSNKVDIAQLRVYKISNMDEIIIKKQIDEIFMIENKKNKRKLLTAIKKLENHQLKIKKVPDIDDYATGKISISDFKRIDIEDLLGRVAVKTDPYLLKSCIKDKNVLVTGAGGSIGSELSRQIIQHSPKKIILLEQSEYFLYKIDNEINNTDTIKNRNVLVRSYLGSVTDKDFIENIFTKESIDTIYHAAANKHVPLVEQNPISAIKTNILGTYVVAENALKANIENFVLVSSDKAVRPTNIMGATKRFAELILQSFQDVVDTKPSDECRTKFCMVRFGNVLDTSGSVVPLFREQIMSGGPVTVTDAKVIRYFMTIQEATELVIQAGSLSKGGEVFLLDMGEPISILNLAKEMIRLSGNEVKDDSNPNGDIEITFTGLRDGEKLYEELLIGDDVSKTIHEHIMSANEEKLNHSEILKYMEKFYTLGSDSSLVEIQNILFDAITGYKPNKKNVISLKSNN